jgi:hypothetical protein
MSTKSLACFLSLIAVGTFLSRSTAFADESNPASLADIHKVLQQAAGYQADTPPTADQQVELLHSALKMLHDIPHVYRGQLRAAAQDINAALDELSTGDTAHKARGDIFDADDAIKSIM